MRVIDERMILARRRRKFICGFRSCGVAGHSRVVMARGGDRIAQGSIFFAQGWPLRRKPTAAGRTLADLLAFAPMIETVALT